jgi:hypothetical protein
LDGWDALHLPFFVGGVVGERGVLGLHVVDCDFGGGALGGGGDKGVDPEEEVEKED